MRCANRQQAILAQGVDIPRQGVQADSPPRPCAFSPVNLSIAPLLITLTYQSLGAGHRTIRWKGQSLYEFISIALPRVDVPLDCLHLQMLLIQQP